jgi:hypothetical protein
VKPLPIALEVEPDVGARRDLDVLVDDAAAQPGVAADVHVLEDDRVGHLGEGIHAHPVRQHRPVQAAARDDDARRDQAVGRDADAGALLVAEHELRRRIVVHAGADLPPAVVHVELGLDGDQIHLRLPVRVDRADVAPVPVGVLARDPVVGKVIDDDLLALLHHRRDDIAAEIVLRVLSRGVFLELAHEGVGREDVVAHARQAHVRVAGHGRRIVGLLVEREDAPLGVGLDDPERPRLGLGDGDGRDREVGLLVHVRGDHLPDVHLVDVVAAEDADDVGVLVGQHVLGLVDRVGRALEPRLARALLGRDRLDVMIEDRRQTPGAGDVLLEARALVLGHHLDAVQPGVHEVREHDIDDAVATPEGDGRLRAIERQRAKPPPLAASEDHHQAAETRVRRIQDHL